MRQKAECASLAGFLIKPLRRGKLAAHIASRADRIFLQARRVRIVISIL